MSDRTKAYLIIAATAIYVISPLDLLPDIFLGAGQLDDLLIGILGYRKASPLLAGTVLEVEPATSNEDFKSSVL